MPETHRSPLVRSVTVLHWRSTEGPLPIHKNVKATQLGTNGKRGHTQTSVVRDIST